MVVRQKERRSIGRILFVGRDQSLAHFYVKTYAIVKTHANVKEHVSQWTCLFIAHKAQCTCSRRVNDRWSGLILFASVVAKWRRYRHQQHGAQLALYTVSILVKKAKTVSDNDTYITYVLFPMSDVLFPAWLSSESILTIVEFRRYLALSCLLTIATLAPATCPLGSDCAIWRNGKQDRGHQSDDTKTTKKEMLSKKCVLK